MRGRPWHEAFQASVRQGRCVLRPSNGCCPQRRVIQRNSERYVEEIRPGLRQKAIAGARVERACVGQVDQTFAQGGAFETLSVALSVEATSCGRACQYRERSQANWARPYPQSPPGGLEPARVVSALRAVHHRAGGGS
jgi:hypothetical protein